MRDRIVLLSHPDPSVREVLAHLALRLAATLVLWRRRARQRRQLAALPPELLDDIGVDPVSARREAARPFWLG